MKRIDIVGLTCVWVSLLFVGLGAGAAWAQEPLRIGASISLSGTYAKPGKYTQEGYLLCEKELNDRGGLLGRKIRFVIYDDKSDPGTAVRLYERLLTEDKVDLVMGPYSSPITNAASTVSEKYKKVMMASLAATTSIWERGFKYLFMTISPAEVYLEGLVELATERGLRTMAVINEDTLFAKAAARGTVELAKKKGMKVVFSEPYPKGHTDFSALLVKIKSVNPDVIAAGSYFDDAVATTRQMRELDVNPRMYGVTVGGDLPEFYQLLGKTAEYVYGSSQWEKQLPYPGIREFVTAYEKMWNREPVYHSAAAYGACQIYAEAIKHANSLDSDKIREQLLRIKTTNVFGDYQVDERGFQIAHKMVLHQWQDGRKVMVWPSSVAEGKPLFPTPPWRERR